MLLTRWPKGPRLAYDSPKLEVQPVDPIAITPDCDARSPSGHITSQETSIVAIHLAHDASPAQVAGNATGAEQ